MALGADAAAIRRMVLWQGIGLALFGAAVGCLAAFVLNRYVVSLVYGVEPWDPLVFICVILLLNIVAVVATLVSAQRAASVHPTEALRHG